MHMYICTFTGTSHGSIFVSYRQCNTFHFRLNITNDNSNDKSSNLVVSKLRFRNASEGLSSHISRIFFHPLSSDDKWSPSMVVCIHKEIVDTVGYAYPLNPK